MNTKLVSFRQSLMEGSTKTCERIHSLSSGDMVDCNCRFYIKQERGNVWIQAPLKKFSSVVATKDYGCRGDER